MIPLPGQRRPPPTGGTAYLCGNADPTFWEPCAAHLRALGYVVIEPVADLREALERVLLADFLVGIAHWQFDRRASFAAQVARELGLAIVDCDSLQPVYHA